MHRCFRLTLSLALALAGCIGLVLLAVVASVFVLSATGRAEETHDALLARAPTALRRSNRAHYLVHAALGRTLALCPCTRHQADRQYARAIQHARSPEQRALVTTDRPRTVEGVVRDGLHLGVDTLRWVGKRVWTRLRVELYA